MKGSNSVYELISSIIYSQVIIHINSMNNGMIEHNSPSIICCSCIFILFKSQMVFYYEYSCFFQDERRTGLNLNQSCTSYNESFLLVGITYLAYCT